VNSNDDTGLKVLMVRARLLIDVAKRGAHFALNFVARK
jgi:hypothetical protein